MFDRSAKLQGNILTSPTLERPDLNSLVGVLLPFRKEKIALVSDIEPMFNQIKVDPKDYHIVRFLWWPRGNMSASPRRVLHASLPVQCVDIAKLRLTIFTANC